MEKLALRSVLYGVDKVPDSWFEKIPGGYFKDKGKEKRTGGKRRDESLDGRKNQRDDRDEYDSGYRSEGRSGGSRRQDRRGRNSYDGGDDPRDGRYRSEGGGRRDRRGRSSYDGGDDGGYNYDRDGRSRPQRTDSRRRRHSVDSDRYGYDDGYGRSSRDNRYRYDDRRDSGRPPYPDVDRNRRASRRDDRPPNPFAPGPYAAGGAAGADLAAGMPPYPEGSPVPSTIQSPSPSRQQARAGSVNTGYVPYSDIYGQRQQQSPNQPFSPPPLSSDGSQRPISRDQASPTVAPPPMGYQQNPFAQQAPTAAAAGAAAAYTGQPGFISPSYDPKYSPRRSSTYDRSEQPYSNSPPPDRRTSRQDYSPSYDNPDSRQDPRRSSRSEYRDSDDPRRSKSQAQGRSKSRLRKHFDTSQRGLGYSAVGALAGGLAGSELGKGVVPGAIGVALGALGSNAFQARERRKDDRRNSEYPRDDMYGKRNGRSRREEGYYSD